jgi:hypothetical protein
MLVESVVQLKSVKRKLAAAAVVPAAQVYQPQLVALDVQAAQVFLFQSLEPLLHMRQAEMVTLTQRQQFSQQGQPEQVMVVAQDLQVARV